VHIFNAGICHTSALFLLKGLGPAGGGNRATLGGKASLFINPKESPMRRSIQAVLLLLGITLLWGAQGRSQEPKEPPMPPEPGSVMPPFVRDQLKLTPQQEKALGTLESDVKGKLKKILTDVQMGLFNEAMRMPPGGPGGPGGGGPGGQPGGPQGGQGKGQPKGPPQGQQGGGPGGGMPMGPPGLVVPPHVTGKLQLNQTQTRQIAELERYAQTNLFKILTPMQQKTFFEELRKGPPRMDGKDGKDGPKQGGQK
jgi:hypothetical protein